MLPTRTHNTHKPTHKTHTQLDESISTCRFAQRVAMVTNELRVNEEVDPAAIIRRLKQEVSGTNEKSLTLCVGGGEDEVQCDKLGPGQWQYTQHSQHTDP